MLDRCKDFSVKMILFLFLESKCPSGLKHRLTDHSPTFSVNFKQRNKVLEVCSKYGVIYSAKTFLQNVNAVKMGEKLNLNPKQVEDGLYVLAGFVETTDSAF